MSRNISESFQDDHLGVLISARYSKITLEQSERNLLGFVTESHEQFTH